MNQQRVEYLRGLLEKRGLTEMVEICDLALSTFIPVDPIEKRLSALEAGHRQLVRDTREAILSTARIR